MRLAYEKHGEGDAVVLLHAFPLDRSIWTNVATRLADEYCVILPDLRGHGESPIDDVKVNSVDTMADDVVELLEELRIETPVMIGGISMGGYVSLSIAIRRPELAKGLILVDTRAGADSPEAAERRERLAQIVESEQSSESVVAAMLPNLFSQKTHKEHPEIVAQIRDLMAKANPRSLAATLRGLAVRPDRTEALVNLSVPTLAVVGGEDVLTPPAESLLIAKSTPKCRYAKIEHAGHLSPLEKPDDFYRILHDFLIVHSRPRGFVPPTDEELRKPMIFGVPDDELDDIDDTDD
jgi:pimeloyl-ACP methyl ester carboxylesterase